jgi:putative redox protein
MASEAGERETGFAVGAHWKGARIFEVRTPAHRRTVDSEGRAGPAPMEEVLGSLAACLGSTVAEILEAMRLPFDGLEVVVSGEEEAESPRVFREVVVEVRVDGAPRKGTERAVRLAETKYCPISALLRRAGTDLRVKAVAANPPKGDGLEGRREVAGNGGRVPDPPET